MNKAKKIIIDPETPHRDLNEFDEDRFQEFLNGMAPLIEEKRMSDMERAKFILADIDRDREDILRKTIEKIQMRSIPHTRAQQ